MMWETLSIVLVLVGLGFLLAEAFVPSGGMLGLLSLLSGGSGIVLAFVKAEGHTFGVVLTVAALILAPAIFLFGLSRLPRGPFNKKLVLRDGAAPGWESAAHEPVYAEMLGRSGVTVSYLRPSGIAEFDGRRFDVVSEGPFIEPKQAVKVIRVEANVLVVRAETSPLPSRERAG